MATYTKFLDSNPLKMKRAADPPKEIRTSSLGGQSSWALLGHMRGFQELEAVSRSPCNGDLSILRCIRGPLIFGNSHIRCELLAMSLVNED